MKKQENKSYYKRNMPHFQPAGYTFFVTFRLAGSLPIAIIKKLKEDREKELKIISGIIEQKHKSAKYYEYQRKYFGIFDSLLDKNKSEPMWLKDEKIAELVKEAIHYRDEKEYELIAYTIMPNHVHLAFTPINIGINVHLETVSRDLSRQNITTKEEITHNDMNVVLQTQNYIVTEILRRLKGSTSRGCNKILNHRGTFWQHESYDHVIRSIDELRRIVNYILLNPVKAGLVDEWEKWIWSYYNPKYLI